MWPKSASKQAEVQLRNCFKIASKCLAGFVKCCSNSASAPYHTVTTVLLRGVLCDHLVTLSRTAQNIEPNFCRHAPTEYTVWPAWGSSMTLQWIKCLLQRGPVHSAVWLLWLLMRSTRTWRCACCSLRSVMTPLVVAGLRRKAGAMLILLWSNAQIGTLKEAWEHPYVHGGQLHIAQGPDWLDIKTLVVTSIGIWRTRLSHLIICTWASCNETNHHVYRSFQPSRPR